MERMALPARWKRCVPRRLPLFQRFTKRHKKSSEIYVENMRRRNSLTFLLPVVVLGLAFLLAAQFTIPAHSETTAPTLTESIVRTPAGSGFFGFGGDNGAAVNAKLSTPNGVA